MVLFYVSTQSKYSCFIVILLLLSLITLLPQNKATVDERVQQLETQIKMLTDEVLELRKALQNQQKITEKISQNVQPQKNIYDGIIEDLQKQEPENQLTKFYRQLIHSQVWIGGYFDMQWSDQYWEDDGYEGEEETIWEMSSLSFQARTAWDETFSLLADIRLTKEEISISHLYFVANFHSTFNLKLGVLKIPFGRYNSIYSPPSTTFASHPITQQFIIPTTWSEPGFAIFGKIQQNWLNYEIMLSSGFRNDGFQKDTANQNISDSGWNGRSNSQQIVGRIGFNPHFGTDSMAIYAGASVLACYYDHSIAYYAWGLDGFLQIGPFFFIGDHDRLLLSSEYQNFKNRTPEATIQTEDLYGYYASISYCFFPEDWRKALSFFTPETELGISFRYSIVRTSDKNLDTFQRFTQYTLAFHFRPIEPSILKLEYSWLYREDDGEENQIIASFSTFF